MHLFFSDVQWNQKGFLNTKINVNIFNKIIDCYQYLQGDLWHFLLHSAASGSGISNCRFWWTGSAAVARYSPSFSFCPCLQGHSTCTLSTDTCFSALLTSFVLIYTLVEEWRLWHNMAPQKFTLQQRIYVVMYYLIQKNWRTVRLHFTTLTLISEIFEDRIISRGPPLWNKRQHARLSRSGPRFNPRSGQVSWVRFFRGFSSPIRRMSGSFRPTRSPNIIWPS